jgi:hypothetical protein
MGYGSWFHRHAKRHKKIVDRLLAQGLEKAAIIDYFDYDTIREKEPGFCPLYAKNEKCHEMEHLNCYLCGCPIFRFSDDGIVEKNALLQMSGCATHRRHGRLVESDGKLHQDCTHCTLPHERAYIEQVFDTEWTVMMRLCEQQ